MNYLSVCSGIEAATVAWHPLGWNPVGFSEIESFPSQVLKHHYPTVPNLGDMTKFKEWEIESNIDVLVGGTPCQSFSVAGLRKGLDDPRGNLMLTYLAIAKQYRPRWLVWENVPGVLSSADGRDFGSFLGGLAICGYGFAYRVLDAQYFGLAQRRKRVFVVGYLGDWRPAAAVLFERESLQGNPAPSRKKGERIAPCVTNGPPFSRTGNERVEAEAMVIHETVGALCADSHPGSYSGQDAYTGRLISSPVFSLQGSGSTSQNANGNGWNEEVSFTLNRIDVHSVTQSTAVRRLTPVECERLQGFPDHYTDIKPKGKQTPDGPRYKALGNSMAVPVMRWIGERIQKVEDLIK